ncbi:Lon protease 2 [Variovorax sp. RA8]|nr:Lon protease 2 [Variovorax sp. RA8]
MSEAPRPIPEDALIVLPMRNLLLFPGTLQPLAIGRQRSQAAAQEAVRLERPLGVLLQNKPEVEDPSAEDLHWVGTSAAVLRYVTTPEGVHHAIVKGLRRFRVLQFLDGYPFLMARVAYVEETGQADAEIQGRAQALKQQALQALQLLPQVPMEAVAGIQGLEEPGEIADVVASVLDLPNADKQALLETFDLKLRLERLLEKLAHRIEVLKIQREVSDRTRESIGDVNRKHLLREQMRTIQKELGGDDEQAAEIQELEGAIADAGMPPEVDEAARKELKRLQRMPDAAGEGSIIRTYLDWLVGLPWKSEAEPQVDLTEARRILDEDHFGLEKIKKRILEYLAVRKLNPSGRSPILCFVGPPGVGKTSLGQSIAKATSRKFVRVSLGGVHDESEIRGHRRTYVGAMPGNIVQAIRKAGTRNCVMMLDEIDKLGAGGQARHRARRVRQDRHPHPRAGRRDAEGRPERRRRDVRGADLAAHVQARPGRCGDDGRDQPARADAAYRRGQGEGAGRAACRHQDRDAAGAQPSRPGGHPGRCARRAHLRVAGDGGRRAGGGAGAGAAVAGGVTAVSGDKP